MATDDPNTWERAGETEIACVVSHRFSAIDIIALEDGHNDDPRANARLIASAPDLLEALILLEAEMVASGNAGSEDYGWPKAIVATRAAIRKATGEAS